MNVIRSNKGFSLVELMVVVAIIGILAAVAIPQFSKFQARSRQSEAKGYLSGVYTANKGFEAEWGQFTGDFRDMGFAINTENNRYEVNLGACGGYVVTNGAPAENPTVASAVSGLNGVALPATAFVYGRLPGVVAPPAACNNAANPKVFTAIAYGNPNSTNLAALDAIDRWTINQNKLMQNTVNGIQ